MEIAGALSSNRFREFPKLFFRAAAAIAAAIPPMPRGLAEVSAPFSFFLRAAAAAAAAAAIPPIPIATDSISSFFCTSLLSRSFILPIAAVLAVTVLPFDFSGSSTEGI